MFTGREKKFCCIISKLVVSRFICSSLYCAPNRIFADTFKFKCIIIMKPKKFGPIILRPIKSPRLTPIKDDDVLFVSQGNTKRIDSCNKFHISWGFRNSLEMKVSLYHWSISWYLYFHRDSLASQWAAFQSLCCILIKVQKYNDLMSEINSNQFGFERLWNKPFLEEYALLNCH